MNYLIGSLVFYFGACFGSFLNVVILRLPKQEDLGGRSHCVSCGHRLSVWDLFPLLSYLFLLGKCRFCGSKISSRYFIIEALVAFLFLFRWLFAEPQTVSAVLLLFRDWVFLSALVVIFVIDLEHFLILDKVLLAFGLPVALINIILDVRGSNIFNLSKSFFFFFLFSGIIFALIFFFFFYFSKGRWIGFGDVKLMLFLGMALGWPSTFVGWMLAFLIGTLVSFPLLLLKKKKFSSKLPLGCFLSIASFLALFWGNLWFSWYLAFLGF